MRRFQIAFVAIFVLFQIGLGARAALAQSIEITNEVWGSYQEYLGRIGVTNPGAFAISRDGGSSYYFYCREPVCRSGTTYRHEAMRSCEDMTGRECVIFALRDEIQIPYTVEPRSTTTVDTPPSSQVVPAPVPEEPPFESPLADGTIVLSHKVAGELEGYLAAVGQQRVVGFFYVSANGREAGAFVCDLTGAAGLPQCPMKPSGPWVDPKPDTTRAKQRASDICEAAFDGDCVMLYANDSKRAAHQLTDNPPPAKIVTSVSAAPAIAVVPEEPPYESPLADGTIVLSRKVVSQLESYLEQVARPGAFGYFYVAPDGRNAGAFVCDSSGIIGLPMCPVKKTGAWVDPKPDASRVKERASAICEADSAVDCVMLYANDGQRATHTAVK
jgi:hypothetical protein